MKHFAIILTLALVSSLGAFAQVDQPFKKAPKGFEQIHILGVVPTESGHTVLLANVSSGKFIPMGVGSAEALSIHMRLSEKKFERPLTHDLLESMMKEMGGELVRVQVDSLKEGVFFGTLVVKKNGKLKRIDARPSDAIALALGVKKPIFVNTEVFAEASIDLEGMPTDSEPEDQSNPTMDL